MLRPPGGAPLLISGLEGDLSRPPTPHGGVCVWGGGCIIILDSSCLWGRAGTRGESVFYTGICNRNINCSGTRMKKPVSLFVV